MKHKFILVLAILVVCIIRIASNKDINIDVLSDDNRRLKSYKVESMMLRPDEVSFKDSSTGKRIRIINMPIIVETD